MNMVDMNPASMFLMNEIDVRDTGVSANDDYVLQSVPQTSSSRGQVRGATRKFRLDVPAGKR